ncbi:MAG: bifunctional glutamate N-acetyltransferase/amino-acid acetyltransferase ArgJ [Rhodobacteraceae bacterium]|nr:bifunctional glutamate N-acetyltransferase/amino-acid acetyltransferase ArgJ [Paracoccaceae bacterium]
MSDISPLAPKDGFPKLPVIDGVRFAAVEAGVKYQGRLDVMLAEIAEGSAISGTFTRSKTRAAPVLWCQENLAKGLQAGGAAILVNSGNANAFTGNNGMNGVEVTAGAVAETLGINPRNVFVASTGVIGEPLPSERITSKMGALRDGLSDANAEDAARAIMTTDTYAKGAKASVDLGGVTVQIAGFAKGSGMIAPDMATMLVFVFTDAKIDQVVLQEIVSSATVTTFNSITVDSDTSTSDSLLVTATGKAAMDEVTSISDPRAAAFGDALRGLMLELAHLVVRDGEGATKFIEITVNGAESDAAAKTVGLSIANSPLVKTAFAGEDPNWGRIVMAIGKAGEAADRDKLSIWFGDTLVADKGWVSPDYREEDGADYMKGQDLSVTVDLGVGKGSATVWTCDLTHQYITINADYRS